ncbi:ribbon-helix-helix DNA binding domain protein [Gordonia phage TinaLin]|uniref:Ribbon-helix-helix DNA binding domain protein n=1 Tax=Gordonia phage TinaLin TaxID=2797324 RepID=A0A7T7GTM4_9CAUD|nr:ribbon-helix-helix DNA binding domain protein [Gordonia phage TinaLin]QQM15158.1 ribbon-helix-helix DNA binding domain protein [Gordonia phage TinaLin]
MTKKPPALRSIVVELPEAEVLKLVRLAGEEGMSVRALASRTMLEATKGIK